MIYITTSLLKICESTSIDNYIFFVKMTCYNFGKFHAVSNILKVEKGLVDLAI